MNIVVKLIILVVAIYVGAYIIPGIKIDSAAALFVVAVVLGILNAFIKPILVLLTLPLTIVTLGVFLLVLNGIIVLVVGSLVPGFHVYSFLSAVLFSVVVSLVSSLLSKLA